MKDVFQPADYPSLLVGLDSPDDAAVWQLDAERALVITTDFFTPVVDDAYDYGAIAAANSLSDVYAMGGQPFLALNVAALPPHLAPEIGAEILRGAAEKAREAGKPEAMLERIAEGTVKKFLKEVTLLGQVFVKAEDGKQTIEQLLKAKGASVASFTLYIVGEGIEKKVTDFAAEVAEQAAAAAKK